MALIADVMTDGGVLVKDAYIVIKHFSFIKKDNPEAGDIPNHFSVIAQAYRTEAESKDGPTGFQRLDCVFILNDEQGPRVQAYEALKQHPQVSNAQDI